VDADGQLNQSSDVVFNGVQGPSGSSLTLRSSPRAAPNHCLTQQVFLVCCALSDNNVPAIAILADAVWVQDGNVEISNTTVTGTVHLEPRCCCCPPSIFPAAPDDLFPQPRGTGGLGGRRLAAIRQHDARCDARGLRYLCRALSRTLSPMAPDIHHSWSLQFLVTCLCRSPVRSRLFLEPMVSARDQQHQRDVTVESDCRWGHVHAC
jgi:hypothetical protein